MSVTISDAVLQSARLTEPELLQEIALTLYQREKLTLAQASRLGGLSRFEFQHLLAARGLHVHYDVEDFETDLQTLENLKNA